MIKIKYRIFRIKISEYFQIVKTLYDNLVFFNLLLDTFNMILNYKYIFSYVIYIINILYKFVYPFSSSFNLVISHMETKNHSDI